MVNLELEQILKVEVKRIGINGEGIAYHEKFAIFIDNALPNEEVEVIIKEVNPKYAKGEIIKILKKSEFRIEPFCEYYNDCGGCQLQHLEYQNSLDFKKEMIFLSISRYSNMNPKTFEIKKTLGMENPLGYRNKSSLPVSFNGKEVFCGMYAKNSNRLVKIENCLIQHPNLNKINHLACEMMDKHNLTCFNPKSKKGNIRYLVTRTSFSEDTSQLSLIVNDTTSKVTELARDIIGKEKIVSVYQSLNNDVKSVDIFKDNLVKLSGETYIYEKLGNLKFSLYPNAFFQLNPIQTIKLYDEIKKACKSTRENIIWDCFCGVGTISLWLAEKAKKVIGFDINEKSIKNANENLSLNKKITNVEFYKKDITKLEPSFITDQTRPDIVVADPPRGGLGELITTIINVKPKLFIYVSCNPSTLAKDLSVLKDLYKVKYIQPIDMFPFTASIESVTVLELIEIKK